MNSGGNKGGRGPQRGGRPGRGGGDPEDLYNIKRHHKIYSKGRDQHISAMTTTTLEGTTLVIVAENNKVVVYDIEGREQIEGEVEGRITAMTIVQHILVVAAVTKTEKSPVEVGRISLLNLTNKLSLEAHLLDPFGRFSHKSEVTVLSSGDFGATKILLSGSTDGSVKMWRLGSAGWYAQEIEASSRRIKGIKIVNDRLFSASSDGTISIWNLAGEPPVCTNLLLPQQLFGFLPNGDPYELVGLEVAPTPDGRSFLLSGASDGSIKVLDISNPDSPSVITGHTPQRRCTQRDQMTCLRFMNTSNGPCLACGYYDSSFIIRSLQAEFAAVAQVTPKGGAQGPVRAVIDIAAGTASPNRAFVIRADYRLLYYEYVQQG
eukprot:gb/GECG01000243.1/.p1 GENE.gb/GECG01000243.1/~~gb/GECG01000243.1/.p1  ORF type:complete len:376 (+),score=26.75 gb/GECG01000243.1/:1-1128(+)